MDILIIRIDPTKKTIAPMRFRPERSPIAELRRICRTKGKVGFRELLRVDGDGPSLIAAGPLEVDRDVPQWKIRGSEDHAGIGVLYALGAGGQMTNCPVKVDWVKSRIIWLEGQDDSASIDEAEDLYTMIDPQMKEALRNAVVARSADEGVWFSTGITEEIRLAALNANLSTGRSKGARLSRIGVMVRDMVLAEDL